MLLSMASFTNQSKFQWYPVSIFNLRTRKQHLSWPKIVQYTGFTVCRYIHFTICLITYCLCAVSRQLWLIKNAKNFVLFFVPIAGCSNVFALLFFLVKVGWFYFIEGHFIFDSSVRLQLITRFRPCLVTCY